MCNDLSVLQELTNSSISCVFEEKTIQRSLLSKPHEAKDMLKIINIVKKVYYVLLFLSFLSILYTIRTFCGNLWAKGDHLRDPSFMNAHIF